LHGKDRNFKNKRNRRNNTAIIKEENEKSEHIYGFITNISKERYRGDISIISKRYRKRCGIETLFKVEDKFNIYTTTRNGVLRYSFSFSAVFSIISGDDKSFFFQIKNIDNGDFKVLMKID